MKTMPQPLSYKNPQPAHRLTRLTPHKKHDPEQVRKLSADHSAVKNSTTVYPSTIVHPDDSSRLLVSGVNSRKIGKRVMRGPWRGVPIFTLTLTERATCPSNCANWLSCYGNNMHYARRHEAGPELTRKLDKELKVLQTKYPKGFLVRLHVLGDFYSTTYVSFWWHALHIYPALHIYGYTSHHSLSGIGARVGELNDCYPERCLIRFSAGLTPDPSVEFTAITLWRQPTPQDTSPTTVLCPTSTDKTACCATCGLCWSKRVKEVLFVGHGQKMGSRKHKEKTALT